MPSYDYSCPKCGNSTSMIVPYSERDNQLCECGEILVKEFPCPSVNIPYHHQAATTRVQPRPLADNGVKFGTTS